MAHEANIEKPEGIVTRLRRGLLWVLFAVVLTVPKIIAARRRTESWNRMRLAAAALGAAAIVAGLAANLGNPARTMTIAAGALVTALAILTRPDKSAASPSSSTLIDLRARALGALVVVDGGDYTDLSSTPPARRVETRLFVGPQQVWVLDTALNTLMEIPIAQITTMRVDREGAESQAAKETWKLHVAWERSTAEFIYRVPFAEHLARVAESTIGSQLRRELPVLR
ncbi:MAG TPA: hypothetical protein VGG55_02115 [Candidatus Acidoferrales bacterium]